MPDIPFAQLLILLAFILVPLINWLLQRMQRRFQGQARRTQPPRESAPRTYAPPPVEVVTSARERVRTPDLLEIARPAGRQLRKRSLFRNRRDLRRAIILMTVLGPCRAADASDLEGRRSRQ
jgi:hypothetical protein